VGADETAPLQAHPHERRAARQVQGAHDFEPVVRLLLEGPAAGRDQQDGELPHPPLPRDQVRRRDDQDGLPLQLSLDAKIINSRVSAKHTGLGVSSGNRCERFMF